jgi:hypothetical protein
MSGPTSAQAGTNHPAMMITHAVPLGCGGKFRDFPFGLALG